MTEPRMVFRKWPSWFHRRMQIGAGVAGGITRDAVAGIYYVWFDDVHYLPLAVDDAELFRLVQREQQEAAE